MGWIDSQPAFVERNTSGDVVCIVAGFRTIRDEEMLSVGEFPELKLLLVGNNIVSDRGLEDLPKLRGLLLAV